MTTQLPDEPYYYQAVAPTEPLELPAQPSILADAMPLLVIAARFIACLAAIGVGIRIVTSGDSQAIAVLAAFACAAVVYGLLSPKTARYHIRADLLHSPGAIHLADVW
jgi:hypothetical protein